MGCFWAVVPRVPVPKVLAGSAGGCWELVPAPGWESQSSGSPNPTVGYTPLQRQKGMRPISCFREEPEE